jgi:hypothetical protein
MTRYTKGPSGIQAADLLCDKRKFWKRQEKEGREKVKH